ncbi:hypothetical protein L1987_63987 [Smallanthus sonchifolius]|uniref:Uncharacterized protein n=1 Tax=Smallanthus sonchifolius TaxID=185202 RepID=A0ACB9CER7_9ASTR|nr:hypothetical protein L1987_63987 [Smallanthus sonchifolius]
MKQLKEVKQRQMEKSKGFCILNRIITTCHTVYKFHPMFALSSLPYSCSSLSNPFIITYQAFLQLNGANQYNLSRPT